MAAGSASTGGNWLGKVVDATIITPFQKRRLNRRATEEHVDKFLAAQHVIKDYSKYSDIALENAFNDLTKIKDSEIDGELISNLRDIVYDEQYPEHLRSSAKTTLVTITQSKVNSNSSQVVDLLSDDGAARLNALNGLLTKLDTSKENIFARLFARSPVLERKIEAILKDEISGNTSVAKTARELISEDLLLMFDNPVEFFHGDKSKELNKKHPELMKKLRGKYSELALRAMPHHFFLDHKKDPEFSALAKNPKTAIVGHLFEMLKEKPRTDGFNTARDKALAVIKSNTEGLYILEDKSLSIAAEIKLLEAKVQSGHGPDLTHYTDEDGSYLSVDQRLEIVKADQIKNDKAFAQAQVDAKLQEDAVKLFFQRVEKYTGNSALKELMQRELFQVGSMDESKKELLARTISPMSETFVKETAAQIINERDSVSSKYASRSVEARLAEKIIDQYDKYKFEEIRLKEEEVKETNRLQQYNDALSHVAPILNASVNDEATLDSWASHYEILGKSSNDTSANNLSKSLKASADRSVRIENLTNDINKGLRDNNIIGDFGVVQINTIRDRQDISNVINEIELAQAVLIRDKEANNTSVSHLIDHLDSLKVLLSEDKQAYENERRELIGSIVYQSKDSGNLTVFSASMDSSTSVDAIDLALISSGYEAFDAADKLDTIRTEMANLPDDMEIFQELDEKKKELEAGVGALWAENLVDKVVSLELSEPEAVFETLVEPLTDSFDYLSSGSGKDFSEVINSIVQSLYHFATEFISMFVSKNNSSGGAQSRQQEATSINADEQKQSPPEPVTT